MPFETQSEPRRSLGPAVASAVAGVVLGGVVAVAAGAFADSTQLPTSSVSPDDAVLGSVQYGQRQ